MDFPRTVGEITPEWLTRVLRESGAIHDSRVGAFNVEAIGGDIGMTASLNRIELRYDREEPNAPKTAIAKLSAPEKRKRELHARLGFYEREALFYEHLSDRSGIGTPATYFTAYDQKTAQLCLLIEDLAHHRAVDDSDECSLEDATRAMRAVAAMHARWWNHEDLDDYPWLLDRPIANTPEQAQKRYLESLTPFLNIVGEFFPSELEDLARNLGPNIPWLCAEMARAPTTLCHGDFKLGNLMFDDRDGAEHPVIAFDWQMPSHLKSARDVAHFLMYALTTDSRRVIESQLITTYHDALVENGVQNYTKEQLRSDIQLALLPRFAGRVTSLVNGGATMLASPDGRRRLMASVERLQMLIDWNCDEVIPK